ncbi:D-alanyl-D-alanine carboxypeptidase [Nonomuraea solani]|uniref:D-alanyl-D-alanine carboxypeptidase n=1 Tax=Nonomuraea solani TaxID=1144553 RepID=A0A1H6BZ90_9ACTN|nr:Clp protease N-terminal domain-containing protein [Nonomuraea solani]SEG65755.1 D-alanyl-D-alanine carboxypeptidase [Nonomuraea solani]
MSAIDHYINAVMERGEAEARADGSAAVEAHHLLLGIAAHAETAARAVLESAGLDRPAIRAALDREFEHSLSAAGVSLAAYDLPAAAPDPERRVGVGASSRLALERGFATVDRKKDLRPAHLLLGVLEAEVGTVPRALALAGVAREDLANRAREAAATEAW